MWYAFGFKGLFKNVSLESNGVIELSGNCWKRSRHKILAL